MMTCERCGHDIPDNIIICPNCGTVTLKAKNPPPPTTYGSFSEGYSSSSSGFANSTHHDYPPVPSQEYRSPQPHYRSGQSFNVPPTYQPATIHVTVLNTNNNTPLIVELLLSIFLGIFGVGWLIAGEVTIGIVLLVCTLFYLPLLILSIFIAFFTFGLSLFCTGPMIIGAIILNAILLNNRLKRKSAMYMPPPPV